jgi:hypothetical protein
MSTPQNRILWRVRAADGSARAAAFDAVVVIVDRSLADGPPVLAAVDVPFERELPATPLTLVVRTNGPSPDLITECEVFAADGTRRHYGRAQGPLDVFVFSERGMTITGLRAPPTGTP